MERDKVMNDKAPQSTRVQSEQVKTGGIGGDYAQDRR